MTTLVDRTMSRLRRLVRRAGDDGLGISVDQVTASLDDLDSVRALISACLGTRGGTPALQGRLAQFAHLHGRLDDVGRGRLYRLLTDEFGTDDAAVTARIETWTAAADRDERAAAARQLHASLEPSWQLLASRLAGLPDGVKFVVDLREDVRRLGGFRDLDAGLRSLLAGWFDIGFIDLEELRWSGTPAAILERLIAYEAVHEIDSWDDLRNRLGPDRRLFAFFHPRMPDEPLIFVEVALVSGMASDLDEILEQTAPDRDPDRADTAVFYSISNCQPGLAGVSFGDALIKRVVARLRAELPQLSMFVTLSPIPGFRSWLTDRHGEFPDDIALDPDTAEVLESVLADPRRVVDHPELEEPLTRLAARYLTSRRPDERPIDSVARFHLSNGARIERLNWMANPRSAGLNRAFGMMVNYRYEPRYIEANQAAYDRGEIVRSPAIVDV